MTAQERWDSLTPAQQEETCTFIMAHFNQAKAEAEESSQGAPAPAKKRDGRPRMYPVHPSDKPYA